MVSLPTLTFELTPEASEAVKQVQTDVQEYQGPCLRICISANGSLVYFVNDEIGNGYLVTNPNAKSFKGKFYKKKEWREKLEATLDPNA